MCFDGVFAVSVYIRQGFLLSVVSNTSVNVRRIFNVSFNATLFKEPVSYCIVCVCFFKLFYLQILKSFVVIIRDVKTVFLNKAGIHFVEMGCLPVIGLHDFTSDMAGSPRQAAVRWIAVI